MKPFFRSPRTPSRLSDSIQHRLNMYALAASTAGVGMLALAFPAEAKVIYTPVTLAIRPNCGPVTLDLNHDGVTDFQLNLYREYGTCHAIPLLGNHSHNPFMIYAPQQSNQAWAVKTNSSFLCAAALPRGQVVGSHAPFQSGRSGRLWLYGQYNDKPDRCIVRMDVLTL